MNFLDICIEVSKNLGLHGSMSTIASPQPIHQNIVIAVRRIWEDIQKMNEFQTYMKRRVSFTTTPSVNEYTIDTIVPDGSYGYIDDIIFQRLPLEKVEWERVPFIYDEVGEEPKWFTEEPTYTTTTSNSTIVFNKLKDEAFDLTINYTKKPQILATNSEVPLLPIEHHTLLVYGATMQVATEQQRIDLMDIYATRYDKAMGHLKRLTNPKKRMMNRRFM